VQAPVDEELHAFPELAAAIKSNRASFDTYVRARFLADESFNRDPTSRAVYARWRSEVLDAFQEESGHICGSYYCEHLIGATARTDRPRFALVFNSHSWGKEEELLTSCDGLYWEGIDYLAGTDRTTFVERLYAVATDVLALLDTRCQQEARNAAQASHGAADAELRSQALEARARKLQDVRAFYAQAAPKRARLRYFAGAVSGFGASIAIAALLLLVLWASNLVPIEDRGEIVTVWLAGAVGAVVSVMQRVSSDSLEIHHESGRAELILLGTIRPLLGGAIAVALYSLFTGGILDFAMPDGASGQEIYYFAGIGFLSGFSERFAQDMLVKTSTRFTATERVVPQRAEPQPTSIPPTASNAGDV
jgi:hypothetical protein